MSSCIAHCGAPQKIWGNSSRVQWCGMPLKHFIVHYMKGQGHWVDICCALGRNEQEPLQQQEKTSSNSAHSLRGHTTCSHTRSWDLSLWVGRKHSVIHATLHNASLDCIGYWQCSSSRKLAGLLPSKPSAQSPNRQSLLSEWLIWP